MQHLNIYIKNNDNVFRNIMSHSLPPSTPNNHCVKFTAYFNPNNHCVTFTANFNPNITIVLYLLPIPTQITIVLYLLTTFYPISYLPLLLLIFLFPTQITPLHLIYSLTDGFLRKQLNYIYPLPDFFSSLSEYM